WPGVMPYALGGLAILTATWVWQEAARWGYKSQDGEEGTVVRNRLTRSLGEALMLFALALGWVVLDTLALYAAEKKATGLLTLLLAALAPILPWLRQLAKLARGHLAAGKQGSSLMWLVPVLAVTLAAFLLFMVDLFAHTVFRHGTVAGWCSVGVAFVFAVLI